MWTANPRCRQGPKAQCKPMAGVSWAAPGQVGWKRCGGGGSPSAPRHPSRAVGLKCFSPLLRSCSWFSPFSLLGHTPLLLYTLPGKFSTNNKVWWFLRIRVSPTHMSVSLPAKGPLSSPNLGALVVWMKGSGRCEKPSEALTTSLQRKSAGVWGSTKERMVNSLIVKRMTNLQPTAF